MLLNALSLSAGGNLPGNFNAILYAGNGASNSLTGVGFKPEIVWVKNRDQDDSPFFFSALRGVEKYHRISAGIAEQSDAQSITSFDLDGFTLGTTAGVNTNTENYVAWCWKADIQDADEHYSPDSGVSVINYTGAGANRVVSHSLNRVPKFIIFKRATTAISWMAYHVGCDATSPEDFGLFPDTTGAANDDPSHFGDTAPTATEFTLSTNFLANSSGFPYTAYVFAEVPGQSNFGLYTGNGNATGPSVTTGFRPGLLMIKAVTRAGSWVMLDDLRDTSNPNTAYLNGDDHLAEQSGMDTDFNATGFQIKTTDVNVNDNGETYAYSCWALL